MALKGFYPQGTGVETANCPFWRCCQESYCQCWSKLVLETGSSWRQAALNDLDQEDLQHEVVAIARGDSDFQFCIVVFPQNGWRRAIHQCHGVKITEFWYFPPIYGSRRITEIVQKTFVGWGRAFIPQTTHCDGTICIWLSGSDIEIMNLINGIFTWMTRQPYDPCSGRLNDSWHNILDTCTLNAPDHSFALANPIQSFTAVVPAFIQNAQTFWLQQQQHLANANAGPKVDESPECPEADAMNELKISEYTPPPSPSRLSFNLGEFLGNANVNFRWLGEGKGTECTIGVHIPSGGDLPHWLRN